MIKKAIFIVGEVCSGKTTITEGMSEFCEVVELGDLVREFHKTEDRVFDNTLDTYLTGKIYTIALNSDKESIVILGCRQVSLIKELSNLFEENEYHYLAVPRYELKKRYVNRKLKKDNDTPFEDVILRDEQLGINDLKLWLLNETDCYFKRNY